MAEARVRTRARTVLHYRRADPDESSRLAVRAARSRGIDATAVPVPAAVFLRALGEFDAVVAPSTTTKGLIPVRVPRCLRGTA